MKRSMRVTAIVLTLIMMVSLMAMSASAKGWGFIDFGGVFYDTPQGHRVASNSSGYINFGSVPTGDITLIFDVNDLDGAVRYQDSFYDLSGVYTTNAKVPYDGKLISDTTGYLVVPAYPDNGTPEEQQAWEDKWGGLTGTTVYASFVPHNHVLSPNAPWHYDDNNHWKDCETCPCWLLMNWHQDVDNDGKCDQCGNDIVYRHVTVKDAPGGKVTVSANKTVLGNRVAINVTPDEGYVLTDIRGINHNKDNSVRPCFEDIKGSQYHMFVDVWDVDIQPTFVKK